MAGANYSNEVGAIKNPSNPCTLYVSNLDMYITEDILYDLFSQVGQVKCCKLIQIPGQEPFAFIEYTEHESAMRALYVMNNRIFIHKQMNVQWAQQYSNFYISNQEHHVFISHLSPEINEKKLLETFGRFGDISSIHIVRNHGTPENEGYVSFRNENDAKAAIATMNGYLINSRSIVTNWSTRRPPPPRSERPRHTANNRPNYEEVTAGAGQYAYEYGQQMNYCNPQGYSQMQGQFLQPAQYYGQYYQQQAQYMNSMRIPAPAGGAWQPGQIGTAPPTPAALLPPRQQPMVIYTMPPQYPTQ